MENRNEICTSPSSLSTSSTDSGDQTLDLGISLQAKGRQLSVESEKSLNQLEELKQVYESLMTEAKDIEMNTDIDNYKAVSKAKNRLAQITGSIEKLQFNKLDAVSTVHLNSGKSKVRSNRRELNTALEELQDFTSSQHAKYDAVTQLESSVCSSSAESISSDSDTDDASVEVMKDVDGTASPHTISDLEVSDDEDDDIDFCDVVADQDVSSVSEEDNNIEKISSSPPLQAQVHFVEPLEEELKDYDEEEELEGDEVFDEQEYVGQQNENPQDTTPIVTEEAQACECLHCTLSASKFLSPSWHSSVQALSQVKALAEATVAARPQPKDKATTENLGSTLAQEEPVQKEPQAKAKEEEKQEETSSFQDSSKPLHSCECGHCRLAAAGWWTPQGIMHARALAHANAKAEAESNVKEDGQLKTPTCDDKKKEKKEGRAVEKEEKEDEQKKFCGCVHCHLATAGFWTPQAVMHAHALAQANNATKKTEIEDADRTEALKEAEAKKIRHERQFLVQQAQEEERRRRQQQVLQQQMALEQQRQRQQYYAQQLRQRQYYAEQQRQLQERQYQQQLLQRQLRQQQLQQQQMLFLGQPRTLARDRFLGALFGM
jgi:hypothetical protein